MTFNLKCHTTSMKRGILPSRLKCSKLTFSTTHQQGHSDFEFIFPLRMTQTLDSEDSITIIQLVQLRRCLFPPPVHCDDLGYTDEDIDRVHVKSNSTIDRVIIAIQFRMIKHLLRVVASVHSE